MVYLSEWLPNPVGDDAKGEFVELFNFSSSTVSLDGWALWTGGKSKTFSLSGYSIRPNGYLVLKKAQTKLSLKNTDGGLWLYGPSGKLMDQGTFKGSAIAGKSFSRVDYGTADTIHFAFVDQTPGAQNKAINSQVAVREYPLNVPLNAPLGAIQFVGLFVGAATTLAILWTYIILKNENLSELIFKRNPSAR